MKPIAFCLILPLLLASCATTPPMKVQVQPGGYALSGPKRVIVLGHRGDTVTDWRVICTACGKTFAHGQARPLERTAGSDRAEWLIDFSTMDVADEVLIECDTNHGTLVSEPFEVGAERPPGTQPTDANARHLRANNQP